MAVPGTDLTAKQKAYADQLIANPGTTQRAAAAKAGMTERQASRLSSNVQVTRYVEAALAEQRDSARALAKKSFKGLANRQVRIENNEEDDLRAIQGHSLIIGGAAKYAESFGDDSEQQLSPEQRSEGQRYLAREAKKQAEPNGPDWTF